MTALGGNPVGREVFDLIQSAKTVQEDVGQARVISHLDMYRTNVLMYCTMVLLARPTKVRR